MVITFVHSNAHVPNFAVGSKKRPRNEGRWRGREIKSIADENEYAREREKEKERYSMSMRISGKKERKRGTDRSFVWDHPWSMPWREPHGQNFIRQRRVHLKMKKARNRKTSNRGEGKEQVKIENEGEKRTYHPETEWTTNWSTTVVSSRNRKVSWRIQVT